MPDKPRESRGRRTWIKLHCYGRLHGSVVYQLTEAEQSVWDKLLCFAGLCGWEGLIADNDGRPYPHSHISHEIHTTEELLEATLKKCTTEGRIKDDANGIRITNWSTYQSEYQRQKPYREAKKGGKGQEIHPPIDTERLRMIRQRSLEKKKELGRDLSPKELQDIKDEIAQELEGE